LAKFTKGTFHADQKPHLDFFTQSFRTFVENANSIGVDDKIYQKLQTLPARVVQKAMDDYNGCVNGFEVLNHGDFWTKNILFLQDGSRVIDTIFVS
jgi:fructosamine-3-kinase